MKITYLYVRHGHTRFNEENRMQGITDSPLSEKGILQVKKAAEALSPVHFDAAYCSPSPRAVSSARIILEGRTMQPVILEDLHEFSYGKMDGMVKNENDPEYQYRFRNDLFDDIGGENKELISKRIVRVFDEIRKHQKDGDVVLIVSHGAFYRHLLRTLMHQDLWETRPDGTPLIPNAGIAVFTDTDGTFNLVKSAVKPEDFVL